ncbi:thiamine phosphate synthase [Rubrivivax gelatinosus]|uniref:Thiamine-phosphate synthase n=1 Tax=Rubrivivax gelatinosus TaxID=28068 RepID=A0ABS1DTX1_RUBGE|nr:thiamine phosphate synthase [Rubrivivax gelatinosus]MBK1712232.1 thiamine phosphate synthase [Rubrivivax gelatinosus]
MTEHATPMRGWGAEALRLMLVTDDALAGGRPLEEIVAAAVQGGVSCVQLREKHLGTRAFVARGRALKALLAPRRVPLVINDRVDVALACGADGVHLGQSDMAVEDARRLLPPAVFIGWSVETLDDVRRAAALPLDYLGTSPVFATTTKLDAAPAWGLDGLRAVRAATALPLVAIGGLHAGNAAQVLAHGADGIAVVSAICSAADPEAAARELALAVAEGAR